MQISIVTTLYNSALFIKEFYLRIKTVVSSITDSYEIIFVDDGSPDNSLMIAQEIHQNDSKVRIIELSRNFGHHKAMATGLANSRGEYVFLIDSDLEEEPELLLKFWDEININNEIDVIYGVQNERKGPFFEKFTGYIYYKLLNKISDGVKTDSNISTVRLMKKNYVKALIEFQEQCFYFGPISNLVGFKQKPYFFKKYSKKLSSYYFAKKYHIFIDSILAFSSKPLFFIFYCGMLLTSLSFLYILYLVVRKIFFGIAINGWTSLIVMVSFFGGINIFFMGLISIYILHIFQETKKRPFSIIRKIHQVDGMK